MAWPLHKILLHWLLLHLLFGVLYWLSGQCIQDNLLHHYQILDSLLPVQDNLLQHNQPLPLDTYPRSEDIDVPHVRRSMSDLVDSLKSARERIEEANQKCTDTVMSALREQDRVLHLQENESRVSKITNRMKQRDTLMKELIMMLQEGQISVQRLQILQSGLGSKPTDDRKDAQFVETWRAQDVEKYTQEFLEKYEALMERVKEFNLSN